MTSRSDKRTPLDERVASGLKVVASGEEALAWTAGELERHRYLARATCACGKRNFIDPKAYKDRPGVPLGKILGHRLVCAKCGSRAPVVEIVDPYRNELE